MGKRNKQDRTAKVDLQCPICGHCAILRTAPTRKGIVCPSCVQIIYLAPAGKYRGDVDEHGYTFRANVIFGQHGFNREFEDIFVDVDEYKRYGI
ncbi:TPA: IS1 family transposase [Streptococcus suis]|nr:IS1 family transposase [Streptococcus suis]